MTELRSAAVTDTIAGKAETDECPGVAELINYALGKGGSHDNQRVEAHLRQAECKACQSWVEKAGRFRTSPWPASSDNSDDPPLSAGFSLASPAPVSVSDQTPIPPSSRWQQQAFLDLERRLRLLDEMG